VAKLGYAMVAIAAAAACGASSFGTFQRASASVQDAPYALTERAINYVRSEASSAAQTKDSSNTKFRYYAALSALNFVQTNLSGVRYNDYLGSPALKGLNVERAFRLMIGECGNQYEAFATILRALKIPVRQVQLFYTDDRRNHVGHVIPEVRWGGKWHMFDVSFGFVPIGEKNRFDVLSFSELRAGVPYKAMVNQNAVALQRASEFTDVFYWRTTLNLDYLIEGRGTIRPYIDHRGQDGIVFGMQNLPEEVGKMPYDGGKTGDIRFAVSAPTEMEMVIHVGYESCQGGTLAVNDVRFPVRSGTLATRVGPGAVTVAIDTPGHSICYAQITGIELEYLRSGNPNGGPDDLLQSSRGAAGRVALSPRTPSD
jgi:hypothetical protein